ncbi:MAG: MarR family transcriptional regulator [Armatimonadetes bacterium]|nr:MarR family transcriptional regulator [Armatimonadota bacterium]
MKPLAGQSNSPSDCDECVLQVLTTVPVIMRAIRAEMRSRRPAGLSVPQFRALAFLYRREGVSLSQVAERMGLTLPTVSKMIDTLVKRGFVVRDISATDRRCVVLKLTSEGKSAYDSANRYAQARLAEDLKALSPSEREDVARSMRVLRRIFMPAE